MKTPWLARARILDTRDSLSVFPFASFPEISPFFLTNDKMVSLVRLMERLPWKAMIDSLTFRGTFWNTPRVARVICRTDTLLPYAMSFFFVLFRSFDCSYPRHSDEHVAARVPPRGILIRLGASSRNNECSTLLYELRARTRAVNRDS